MGFYCLLHKYVAHTPNIRKQNRNRRNETQKKLKETCNRQTFISIHTFILVLMAQGFFSVFFCCVHVLARQNKKHRNYNICRRAYELDNRNGNKNEINTQNTARTKNWSNFFSFVRSFIWAISEMGLWLSIVIHFERLNPLTKCNIENVFCFVHKRAKSFCG